MVEPSQVRVVEPLAPFAVGFIEELERLGYRVASIVGQMKLVANLSRWMARECLGVEDLSPEVIASYVAWRREQGYRGFVSERALRPLITFLRALGAAPATVARQAGEVDRMLQRYRVYLESERGLASDTLLYYERVARAFLNSIEQERRHPDAFSGRSVSAFVLDDCRERNSGSARNVVVALRAFLWFLHVEGLTAVNLAAVVPAVAPHARKLPRSLDPDAVTQLLGSCDRQTVSGRRTFAVLGLLSRLGLRAAEVAAIGVGDIDWRAGELLVRGKGRRRSVMPVPVDVGEALADYLQHARAPIASDRLFVHLKAPAAPITPAAVAGIVRQACRVAGVPSIGPHRLRHAAATQTLRAGASLAEVAQLLRQQTEFTTAIYARVDRAALATVARQWPEVKR